MERLGNTMDALNQRYNRHLLLPNFTLQMQQKLVDAKILVIGAGGLACPVLEYLNAAGVGKIGIIDGDVVSLSNLQRQTIYTESDIGKSKVHCAAEYLRSRNSITKINTYPTYFSKVNALDLVSKYDVIVDCSDNFGTRYLVNDSCVLTNKPFVFGALYQYAGQVSVFNYKGSATYRCLFPEPPTSEEMPACNEAGVLGIVAGLVGNLQALETIKLITGLEGLLQNQLLNINFLSYKQSCLRFERENHWPNWDEKQLLDSYDIPCLVDTLTEIEANELNEYLTKGWTLIDVRTKAEFAVFNIGGQNIPIDTLNNASFDLGNYILLCQSGIRSLKALEILNGKYPTKKFKSIKKGLSAF